jgi:hypothetical protein
LKWYYRVYLLCPLWKIEETDMEKENELYGIPNVGPPSMLAYKPESKQPPVHFEKVSNLKHFG